MIKNAFVALAVASQLAACDRDSGPTGYQGVVELDERVLGFEVAGRVIAVNVRRGDVIAPASVVATLDDAQAQTAIAIREAEARAAQERAKLVAAGGRREDIRALEAQLRAAEANEALAAKQHADNMVLVAAGAIPRSVTDDSAARAKTATAEREALAQRLRELRAGGRVEEVASARAQAAAAVSAAALETDRAHRYQLRALHAGEVLDVHVEPGEVVAPGTPVITVGDPAHPYVDVFVPQTEIGRVRVGTPVTIRVDATARTFAGIVEHVARRTEFTPRYIFSEDERANLVIRVRIRVDDPEHALHPGVPAFATIGA
jgi:HlyD family secretion protein